MPPEIDEKFDFPKLVTFYQTAFEQALAKQGIFLTSDNNISKIDKDFFKQQKAKQQQYVDDMLPKNKQLGALAALLEELRQADKLKPGTFIPPEDPILKKHGFSDALFIRESQHHSRELRIEVVNPKLLGQGAIGKVFESRWVLKIKPQTQEGITAQSIKDIKVSNKVIKRMIPLDSEENELQSAKTFTKKGQAYTGEDSYYYLILHRAPGKPLESGMTADLSANDIVFLVYQLLASATNIHQQGWVHADAKPDNIMLEVDPQRLSAELIDFSECKRIGEQVWCGFGSPLIALAELENASKTHPYQVDAKTDSPALAAAIGVLCGTDPFHLRRDAILANPNSSAFAAMETGAKIPYDFSGLFQQLKHKPDEHTQLLLLDIINNLNKNPHEHRITAEQAMELLQNLHPALGVESWEQLRTAISVLSATAKENKLPITAFSKILIDLKNFIHKKNEGSNTENPITCYQDFIVRIKEAVQSLPEKAALAFFKKINGSEALKFLNPDDTLFSPQFILAAAQDKLSQEEFSTSTTFVKILTNIFQKKLEKGALTKVIIDFLKDYINNPNELSLAEMLDALMPLRPQERISALVLLLNHAQEASSLREALHPYLMQAIHASMKKNVHLDLNAAIWHDTLMHSNLYPGVGEKILALCQQEKWLTPEESAYLTEQFPPAPKPSMSKAIGAVGLFPQFDDNYFAQPARTYPPIPQPKGKDSHNDDPPAKEMVPTH